MKRLILMLGVGASTCGRVDAATVKAKAARPELVLVSPPGADAMVFAPGDEVLALSAVGDEGRGIQLWDARGRGLKGEALGARTQRAPVFSSDGRYFVTQFGASASIWDSATGRLRRTLSGLGDVLTNGRLVVSLSRASKGSKDLKSRRMRVFAVPSGRLARDVAWEQAPEPSEKGKLFLSGDGRLLARASAELSLSAPRAVTVWDVGTGKRVCTTDRDNGSLEIGTTAGNRLDAGGAVLFSRDGRRFWTGGLAPAWRVPPDGTTGDSGYLFEFVIKEWDTRTGSLKRIMGSQTTQDRYEPLALSPNGGSLLCNNLDILRLRDGRLVRNLGRLSHTSAPVSISPDSSKVAVVKSQGLQPDQTIVAEIYSIATGQLLRRVWLGKSDATQSARVALGNSALASVSYSPFTLAWWNPRTGKKLRSISIPAPRTLVNSYGLSTRLLFSRDGARLGVQLYGDPGQYIVWNTRSGHLERAQGEIEYAHTLILSPDGRDFTTKNELAPVPKREPLFAQAGEYEVVSPDGSLAAVRGGEEKSYNDGRRRAKGELLSVYDVASRELKWQHQGEKGYAIEIVGFSPDGKALAVKHGGELALWDTASAASRVLNAWRGMNLLGFSQDGHRIAGRGEGPIRVWDVASGKLVGSVSVATLPESAVAISPDGKRLAFVNPDTEIVLYDVDEAQVLARLTALLPPGGSLSALDWIAETPQGFYDASPGASRWIRWRVGEETFPAARFERTLKRPDLLRQILAGK